MKNAAQILADDLGEGEAAKPRRPSQPKTSQTYSGEGAFKVANRVQTRDVLDRLGISHGEKFAVCPGCGEDGALICADGGLKCLHARCAHVGPRAHPGFRTNADMVAEREQLEPLEAAMRVCEWFGLDFAKKSAASAGAGEPDYEHTDADAPGAASGAEPQEAPKSDRVALTISEVLTEWAQSGPLIHEPTGISQLDEFTGGGPVYGTRWYLGGSPDAGKTALLVQLAHEYARRGVTVGLLAVDEEAGDLVTRFAQRVGYSRSHCEVRDQGVLAAIEGELGALPLRLYDAAWTIEAAAADLATVALGRAQQDPSSHPHGPRAMLGVDSIQTVSCAADFQAAITGRELSEVSAVTARVRALRAVATRHRLIAIATSELGRGAYRSSDPSQQTSILAAGKWSGAIEYSARVLLGLRSVAGEQDLVEVEIAKNKHGPRDEKVYLRIDRRSQTLTPVAYDPPPPADRDAAAKDKATADAITVARLLLARPRLSVREFRAAAKSASGISHERVDVALDTLGAAVVRGVGPNRSMPLSLELERLPEGIRRAVEESK